MAGGVTAGCGATVGVAGGEAVCADELGAGAVGVITVKALPVLVCGAADCGRSRAGVGRGESPVRGEAGGVGSAGTLMGCCIALRKRSRAFCSWSGVIGAPGGAGAAGGVACAISSRPKSEPDGGGFDEGAAASRAGCAGLSL